MSGADLLFNLRNFFHLGAFQAAINEASDLTALSGSEALERDFLVYRSYVALGSLELVISEIGNDAPMGLLAVRLLAQYLSSSVPQDKVLETLSEWMADPVTNSNPMVCLIAGTIHCHEENYVEALKSCHSGATLEMMSLCVQVYLLMNRPDKAEEQVKAMSQVDDDATITQLSTAWTGLALGGAKVQDAFHIFQELGDRHQWTGLLHNGSGVCNMRMDQYEDAERDLLDALNKDANNPTTLANLIACELHLGKPVSRYVSQLKMTDPGHIIVKEAEAAEGEFDKAASAFS
ncbi:unnamed protein product [Ostreobium quekettii]|uniref:Coatomer subunit epsilon n=1 Tax=Ostreobium quekettii TaxID=121088 RepID=A0A8S1J9D2_9CHLO|nr:unnamed protein product [Ostreobium quekettii]|eukprot:evm.model.scf_561EXC.6 EVM.evm.TU.scf_561EXC.6   scf_561EXC:35345-42755(-)